MSEARYEMPDDEQYAEGFPTMGDIAADAAEAAEAAKEVVNKRKSNIMETLKKLEKNAPSEKPEGFTEMEIPDDVRQGIAKALQESLDREGVDVEVRPDRIATFHTNSPSAEKESENEQIAGLFESIACALRAVLEYRHNITLG